MKLRPSTIPEVFCMDLSPPKDRLELALATATPSAALLELAEELRDGGMPQEELLALFDAARERHAHDADETGHNAILDVMDLIVDYCSPSRAIYPKSE